MNIFEAIQNELDETFTKIAESFIETMPRDLRECCERNENVRTLVLTEVAMEVANIIIDEAKKR